MAVKQNNTDGGGPSSTSTTQTANQSTSEKKTWDLEIILEIIDLLNSKQNQGEFPTGPKYVEIYNQIVLHLSKVAIPRVPQEMKRFKEDINKVGVFLSKVSVGDPYTVHLRYLQTVCQLITGPETPSGAIAIVFQLFPEDLIPKAVSLILSSTEHATDEAIRKTVNVLCNWLRCCVFCQNLNLWILAILNGLREQQKYMLLYDIAMDIIEPLFIALIIPILRPKAAPVVFHVLSSVKHTPAVFHKIISRAPKVIKQLKNDNLNIEETKKILQNMVDLLSALMAQFQGYDELYKETEEALTEFTPSYDFRSTLDYPAWADVSDLYISHNNARVGLVNLGNTCYMNSVLQALAMTKEFSREILLCGSKSPILLKIQQLLALMLHSSRPELTPGIVLHATRPPGFIHGFQQDSSEFLGYLLEMLHEFENKTDIHNLNMSENTENTSKDVNNSDVINVNAEDDAHSEEGASSTKYTIHNTSSQHLKPNLNEKLTTIEKTFAGKITTTYKCLACGWESKNTDTFRDLQLAFPELKTDCASNYSVQDLLDYYCSSEKLYGDNQYFCEKCKRLHDAQRFINIVSAPKNLILTLKHFKYDQKYHMRAKLMHKVFHDESVSVKVHSTNTLEESSTVHYNLYAAVVHTGFSMDSGHYYTYASDKPDCWFKLNDNVVTTCSISELHNLHPPNTPYILFYQMKSIVSESSTAGNKVVRVEVPTFPTIDELPSNLREYVNKDNLSFKEETRIRKLTATGNRGGFMSFNKGGDGGNGDNDDEPPSSCGGNSLNYFNRFIC